MSSEIKLKQDAKPFGKYGCFIDGLNGEDCVFNNVDGLTVDDCVIAIGLVRKSKSKNNCPHWKKVKKQSGIHVCPNCHHSF